MFSNNVSGPESFLSVSVSGGGASNSKPVQAQPKLPKYWRGFRLSKRGYDSGDYAIRVTVCKWLKKLKKSPEGNYIELGNIQEQVTDHLKQIIEKKAKEYKDEPYEKIRSLLKIIDEAELLFNYKETKDAAIIVGSCALKLYEEELDAKGLIYYERLSFRMGVCDDEVRSNVFHNFCKKFVKSHLGLFSSWNDIEAYFSNFRSHGEYPGRLHEINDRYTNNFFLTPVSTTVVSETRPVRRAGGSGSGATALDIGVGVLQLVSFFG